MVVMRACRWIVAALLLAPMLASAQHGSLRAYVPNKEIMEGRQFWLVIEASGATVEIQDLPECDGVVINTASPQQSTRLSIGGGAQQQDLRVSFPAIAIRAGKITIPAIQALINGRTLQTDPIVLDAKAAPADDAKESPVRAWVESPELEVGRPFWIYVEAKGIQIELPDTIAAEGIAIDPVNVQRSVSHSLSRDGQTMNAKRGYLAIATREGEITIPPIEVQVTGRLVKTEPIMLNAKKVSVQAVAPEASAPETELTQDDLVFIRMQTDKTTAYQGEAILLTMQLWRIQNRRINAGPYRGSLITGPTTEGFFTRELEPVQYEAKNGHWNYDVTETRKLLYPTRPGTLRVGVWHWEGIALVDRQSVVQRDRLNYQFDAGPIDITVQPLPASPAGFTGAVGMLEVEAALSSTVATQGVPFALNLRVQGSGNPDSVGDPILPALDWATSREPERTASLEMIQGTPYPRMDKRFVYPITPLKAGQAEIPQFPFVYFDPVKGAYETKQIGPFPMDVLASSEDSTHVMASPEVPVAQRKVEILAEDIRPLLNRPVGLAPSKRGSGSLWMLVFAFPALAYVAVRIVFGKKRRLASDVSWARSLRARSTGLRRLQDVAQSPEPAVALFRAVAANVADTLNLGEAGLTSSDVQGEMGRAGVPSALTDRTVQILRACERARYGTQRLSRDEVTALISAAESCMHSLDAFKSGRKKS